MWCTTNWGPMQENPGFLGSLRLFILNGRGCKAALPGLMSCLVWNCCGLGNLLTEKELGVLVRAKDPSVMFIAETWADEARLKDIKRKLEFDHLFVVPRINRGGGLALFWRNSIDVNVETSSKYHIDSIINKGREDAWRFTGFYGELATHLRHESWTKLRQLNSRFNLPWLCAGDFNEIVRSEEKCGGSNRSQPQMQMFREVIDECGFLDLGFVGPQFTWSKHYAVGHLVWERLDRGLANYEWLRRFAGAKVHHLHSNSSDHCPLWIVPSDLIVDRKNKPFRFEEIWLPDKGCTDTVEVFWLSNGFEQSEDRVIKKIEKYGYELTRWSREKFGSVRKELERNRRLLTEAEKEAMTSGLNYRIRDIKKEIDVLLDRENRMWLQRSKVLWAAQGDKNSRFFHSKATKRCRKNFIEKIRNSDRVWNSDREEVKEFVV